jgi:hypothetical protein
MSREMAGPVTVMSVTLIFKEKVTLEAYTDITNIREKKKKKKKEDDIIIDVILVG